LAEKRNSTPLYERNKHGEVIRPKYELISSHTSRRSGATNLYKLGVLSNMEMRSITGHQSEKVFENYIRVSLSEQAQIVGDKILAAKKAKDKKNSKQNSTFNKIWREILLFLAKKNEKKYVFGPNLR